MLKTTRYARSTKTRFELYRMIPILMVLAFAGCSATASGRLQNSPEVTKVFQSYQILPNHQYYISGFQNIPFAIIAIDNNYQLRPSRWKPIDMNTSGLSQLIYRMDMVYSLNPRGAWIVDHEGNRVGVWFSSQYQTVVRREKENQIVVLAPEPPDLRGIR